MSLSVTENFIIVEIDSHAGLSTSNPAKGCKFNNSKAYGIDPFNSDLNKQADLMAHKVSQEKNRLAKMYSIDKDLTD